ncbi:MAG: glycosyltransferase family 2 protein [Acidobacteriia bacterium]|nr:glycosyltransferase family 2 protein [Terriglobia bacterium]
MARTLDMPDPAASSAMPAGASSLPLISVVVPVRNEGAHLPSLFEDLVKQQYPPDRYEILVADGNSTDRTREIVERYARESVPRVLWLPNPRQLSSAGRNVGVEASRGELILFIDGHCRIPSPTLFLDTARIMQATGADCLCRPVTIQMPGNTWFQDAVARVRATSLGHGRDSTIYATDFEGFVNPTSAGAFYRRAVFDLVGMHDERFDACEDVDFNYRVFKAGLRSYLSSRCAISYRPRSSLRGLFKQVVRYGRGRVRFVRKHPDALTISQLGPAAFVAWLAGGVIASCVSTFAAKVFLATLLPYVGLVLVFSGWLGLRHGWRYLVVAPAVYLAVHVGLGMGFWTEAGRPVLEWLRAKPKRSATRPVSRSGARHIPGSEE